MDANSNPPITIVDRFKSCLFHKRITITHVAMQLGISRQAVYNWINNGSISQKHIASLCSLLDISAEWLLFGSTNTDDCNGGCYKSCELRKILIDLLLEKNHLVAEHDMLDKSISWHGLTQAAISGDQLPPNEEAMSRWIDPDSYQMFHHALSRYHLYREQNKLVFPLQKCAADAATQWLDMEFVSRCNNRMVYYTVNRVSP